MKTLKNILAITILAFFFSNASAKQDTTVTIKTSAECGSCKKRIENALNFEKGVKSAEVSVNTKIATVIFDPTKTSIDKIREAISKTGYQADEVAANEKALKKLPTCCKPDGMKKE